MQKLGVTHVNVSDAFDLPTPNEVLFEGFRRAIRNLRLLDECDDLSLETLVLILRDTQEWAERWGMMSPDGERFGELAALIEKDLKGIKRKAKRLMKEASLATPTSYSSSVRLTDCPGSTPTRLVEEN